MLQTHVKSRRSTGSAASAGSRFPQWEPRLRRFLTWRQASVRDKRHALPGEVVESVRHEALQPSIGEAMALVGDRRKVGQSPSKLMRTACKYSSAGGSRIHRGISVSILVAAAVTVEQHGEGVPAR